MIDLRSDTQTKPSQGMLAAMLAAELGDEQRREDPTTIALEERAAAFLGQEEAVYLPTATMANQIALSILGERGTELLVEESAHIMVSELGGAAFHSGLQTRGIRGERGRLSPEQIERVIRPRDPFHSPRVSVLALENTHNNSGGAAWPPGELVAAVNAAHSLGLSVHLDGARLANAAVACGVPASELAAPFDTVALCLSKGLGCPMGALIAGSGELMRRARLGKHRFGGALRQSGIVAAAGLYALEHHVDRLADDHARAKRLAQGWAAHGLPVEHERVETNFVQIELGGLGLSASEAIARLAGLGLWVSDTVHPGTLRAVTHLGIGDTEIEQAITLGPAALELLAHA